MIDRTIAHPHPDEELERLAAGIANRIGFDPPEIATSLQPPQLRVARSRDQGTKSYTVVARSVPTIVLGGMVYTAVERYCGAAATYFLPSQRGGKRRPSKFWKDARNAVATALDWCTSPATEPKFPEFYLTPWHDHVARAFAIYTYRFILCHEMAHVALGHLDSPIGYGDDVTIYRAAQQQELDADSFALEMQLRSLPDRTQVVTALASCVYFLYFNWLFDDTRLGLLTDLVDHRAWEVEYSHPPLLHRLHNLIATAHGLEGSVASEGLNKVHGDLSKLVQELQDIAWINQNNVATEVINLLEPQSRRRQPDFSGLLPLFERSPLGVLRALEQMRGSGRQKIRPIIHKVLEQLPEEFGEFYLHTPAERSKQLA